MEELRIHYKCSRSTIAVAKKKYGFVGLSPNSKKLDRDKGVKSCNVCGKSLPLSDFYSNGKLPSGLIRYKPSCTKCENYKVRTSYYQKLKTICLELDRDPTTCQLCGYNKNMAAICFHHANPKDKTTSLGEINKNIALEVLRDILTTELPKGTFLCHNCHMEVHYPHLKTEGLPGLEQ